MYVLALGFCETDISLTRLNMMCKLTITLYIVTYIKKSTIFTVFKMKPNVKYYSWHKQVLYNMAALFLHGSQTLHLNMWN